MSKIIDRNLIIALYQKGHSKRWIAKFMEISRNTIKKIILNGGEIKRKTRNDRIPLPEEMILQLYAKCEQRAERTHEMLVEQGYQIAYSTLTNRLRELTGPKFKQKLSCQYQIQPGEEFQHDTSPIRVMIAGKKILLQASSLIFRFSRQRYLKFYRQFKRFNMQCFIHETLMYYGHSCPICVIDNTNLAVLKGTGQDAVMVPEMELFAKNYGFKWVAHEIGHSDRKASVESSFNTVLKNFLPGREFISIDDLNTQALEWCKKRAQKKVAKVNQTPEYLFSLEQPHLKTISTHISAPYLIEDRKSDQYGFISFKGNDYYVGYKNVKIEVLYFESYIKLFKSNKLLWQYLLPLHEQKGQQIVPDEIKQAQSFKGNRSSKAIETRLSESSPVLKEYFKIAFSQLRAQKTRNSLARNLESLHKFVPNTVFLQAVKKATVYKIFDIQSIKELIRIELVKEKYPPLSLEKQISPEDSFPNLEKREIYQSFKNSPEVDLSKYSKKFKKEKN